MNMVALNKGHIFVIFLNLNEFLKWDGGLNVLLEMETV